MEALSSIGSFFSGGGGKLLDLGLLGAGLGGNMAANAQKQKLDSELNNPAYLGQSATKLAGQLNPALVQAVNNQVGGTLAEQGLSQSPGIVATSTSQALAPYVQQNYNTALSSIIQSIEAALGGSPNPTNLAPLIAMLTGKGNPGGGATTGSSQIALQNLLNNPAQSGSYYGDPSSILPDTSGTQVA